MKIINITQFLLCTGAICFIEFQSIVNFWLGSADSSIVKYIRLCFRLVKLCLSLQHFTVRSKYLSHKLIFITMRHFIDGRRIDSATLLSYNGVFRGGDCATAPFGLTMNVFGDMISRFSEFLESQFKNVIRPMKVRPLSQILNTSLVSYKCTSASSYSSSAAI
jgi:hypothetical protein